MSKDDQTETREKGGEGTRVNESSSNDKNNIKTHFSGSSTHSVPPNECTNKNKQHKQLNRVTFGKGTKITVVATVKFTEET